MIWNVAVFAFGLAVGSFLNAFVYRLEVQSGLRQISHNRRKTDVTVLRGRSFCPTCGHTLAWYDLIPLVSFFLLRGRCRYCEERISWQYPLVEFVTGLVFVGIGFHNLIELSFPQIVELLYLWTVASVFIVIFVYDLKHYIIPDKILYPSMGLAFLWRVFEFLNFDTSAPLVISLLAGFGTSLFFFTIYTASKGRAMGFGDVKLAFLLGLFLGWPLILLALFWAFSLGAVFGVGLIALKKKTLKSEVPFAPFLIAGTAIAFFFGSNILSWYLGLFLV